MSKELLITWIQPSSLGDMLLVARLDGALLLLTWDDPYKDLRRSAALPDVELAPTLRLRARSDGELNLDDTGLPPGCLATARALGDYFAGRAAHPQVAVDLRLARSEFHRQVLEALLRIKPGTLTSYGALAKELARPPGAARAVGQAVGKNPIAVVVPCHRVVASDGSLGGFSGELWRKRQLLTSEGIAVPDGGWEVRRLQRPAAVAAI